MSNLDVLQSAVQSTEIDDRILTTTLIANILSIVSGIFSLVVTVYTENYKKPHGRMVLDLSILNLIYNTLNILLFMEIAAEPICQILSFFSLFGYYSSIFYTCCFADTYYRNIKVSLFDNTNRYLRRYIIASTMLGIALAAVGILMKVNDIEEPERLCRCFEADLNFTNYGIPALLSVVFCAVCFISSFSEALERKSVPGMELLFYPIILIIACLPIIVVGLYYGLTKVSYVSFNVGYLEMLLLNGQAFLNGFVQIYHLVSWRAEKRLISGDSFVKSSLLSAQL